MSNPLRSARANGEEGLSLIELMISMFILGVALIALVGVAGQSLISLRATRDREQATNAASSAIEDVRERDWADIALPPNAVAPADLASFGGCFEAEPIVQNVVTDPVDFESTVGHNAKITVRTLVTWADGSCAAGTPTDNKRIIAEATWDDRGVLRTVRQETLVAPAARGLPVPNFQLRPETKTIILSSGSGANETCGRHQLRNLGARDTYDWRLVGVAGEITPPTKFGNDSFYTPNGDWSVRAFFESPGDETRDIASGADVEGFGERMRDLDANDRPEAVTAAGDAIYVAPKGDDDSTANIWICWEADDVADGSEFEAEIAVHSRFDGTRLETIRHTVRVGFTGERWFLFDPIDDTEHDRGVTQRIQGSDVLVYPPYPMGPAVTVEGSPERLGTIDYSDPTKSNWDRDVDLLDDPGVRLIRTATDRTRSLEWHEQLADQTTTLSATMMLEIWVSTATFLDDPDGIDEHDPLDLGLEITLERLNKNESTVEQSLGTTTFGYQFADEETGLTNGFKKLTIPLTLSAAPTFGKQEFLSLRITCASTSDDDCVLAYDNTAHQSALTVVRQ